MDWPGCAWCLGLGEEFKALPQVPWKGLDLKGAPRGRRNGTEYPVRERRVWEQLRFCDKMKSRGNWRHDITAYNKYNK